MANIKCNQCKWVGPPQDALASMSAYHDMHCPECGTSDLDTSELNAEWAADGERYGYGDHNFLDTSNPTS